MNEPVNPLIEEFVREYAESEEEYKKVADMVCRDLKSYLDGTGIMAIVSSRAKDSDRLKGKLMRDEAKRIAEGEPPFKTQEDIWKAVHDLVGARIALYFPRDVSKIPNILRKHFFCGENPKIFPPRVPAFDSLVQMGYTGHKRRIYPGYDNRRFDGYQAVHFQIRYENPPSGKIPNPDIEVQVASVLMHAWSEVEHDLAYKKMTGEVSREEYEVLDEINGLVIAGEIALNRLNQLSKQRQRMEKTVENSYSLGLYLEDWLEQWKGRPLEEEENDGGGNVQQLFEMYEMMDMLTPTHLEANLKKLGPDVPGTMSGLIEMLIDKFCSDNRKKAKQIIADNVMEYAGSDEAFYSAAKIGTFLGKWNTLEDLVRRAVRSLGYKCYNSQTSWKYVVDQKVLPDPIPENYHTLRLQRNAIVHSNRLPEADRFQRCMEEMDRLSELLKKEYNLK